MKRTYSFPELHKILNPVAPATYFLSFATNSISTLIKTTKGKEKLLALIQYISELFKITMMDYVKNNDISTYPIHLLNTIQVEKSMKNGRKLMRVLMFTDDLGALERSWKNRDKFNIMEALQVFMSIANIVYYLLDNLVWCADIGIISKFIAHANIKWKDTKDMSSLARCVIGLTLSFIASFQTKERIRLLKEELMENPHKKVEKDKNTYGLTCDFVTTRREYRVQVLEAVVSILRFFMLAHALGFPLFKKLSKIFIAVCGISATSLSIFFELFLRGRIS
ncbi:hypothetical protein SteCoe_7255 [Stentor coeruleus]|uniref:Uncharacterized protein n=1 Tax=Stentor coeruleus TaxID=5963 RepID=A0A1R2CN09_9CILI|nr:hypothetical protein SteCoe_7255 [Stentor coeruleus]